MIKTIIRFNKKTGEVENLEDLYKRKNKEFYTSLRKILLCIKLYTDNINDNEKKEKHKNNLSNLIKNIWENQEKLVKIN